jgi:tRNA pseudouridine38-40 synthase
MSQAVPRDEPWPGILDTPLQGGNFSVMAERTVQLVLQYDGARFAGWQRQPQARTIQGEIEDTLSRLCNVKTRAVGAGRTDAGVHARGQAVSALVPATWAVEKLRRALNALLPDDIWVAAAYEMEAEFHARYSALSRRYSYRVGTDDEAHSPFRARWEWSVVESLDRRLLDESATALLGDHCFRAYAVRGTAHERDNHRCQVQVARWGDRPGGLTFEIAANRFLHHMVRFIVGTMVAVATGRRDAGTIIRLLDAPDNSEASPPAPAHALCLEQVEYPRALYRSVAS